MTLSIVSLRAVALVGLTAAVALSPGEALATTGGWALREAPQQAQGAITGLVTEGATQRAIGGVIIRVGNASTTTDSEGRFELLRVPTGTVSVRAQIIGYGVVETTVSVRGGQQLTVNFEMTRRAIDLEEIVVSVSAADARRVEFGTDIEVVNAVAEVQKGAVGNMSDLLGGRTAGVDVQMATGPIGTASRVRVRGVSSFSMGANPIIVIDGIRVSNETDTGPESIDWTEGRTVSRLDDINPQDIESVQIIKGPTATALYGAGAASGVILIQTKRGRQGEHIVNINTEIGFVEDVSHYWDKFFNFTKHMGISDVNDPIAQQWDAISNPITGDVWGVSNPMTNALTSPLRKGFTSNTSVDVSGGGEGVQYFVSARYQNQQGAYPTSRSENTSLRANITSQMSEDITITVNANYVENEVRYPESSRSFRGYSLNGGSGENSTSFGILPDGTRGDCLAAIWKGRDISECERQQGNLIANFPDLNTVFSGQEIGRFIGSATLRWTPFSWLTNRLVGGVDHIQTNDLNEFPLDERRPFGVLSQGFIRDQRLTDQNRTYEYTGTVTLNPEGVLASTTTFGAQYFTKKKELVGCTGEGGFASPTATACDAALIRTGFSNIIENREAGAYAQQRLGYKGYLFATAGIRFDDNSSFGINQGGIWSPSFNGSVVLSEMPFWNVGFINSFRIRGAWGTAAQAPPPSAALRRLIPVALEVDGAQIAGVAPAFPGNPDLTAERKSELEFGFDAALLDDRFSLKATYFRQKTTDAILSRFLAPSLGFRGEQFVNVGALENKGIEVSFAAQIVNTPNFSWDLEFRASTQDPIVTDLGGFAPLILGSNRGVFQEGFAPGTYYGPIIESAERDAAAQIKPSTVMVRPGDLGLASNPYYSNLGSPQAKNFQNLSTTVTLLGGRLRLATLFDRKGDVSKRNGSAGFLAGRRDFAGSWQYAFREGGDCRCQTGDKSRVITAVEQAGMEKGLIEGSIHRRFVFIEDGAFIKWREATVTYDVPNSLLQFFGGTRASITIGGRNLATWTNYTGADPEIIVVGGRTAFPANETFFGEALTRRWFTRVNLTF